MVRDFVVLSPRDGSQERERKLLEDPQLGVFTKWLMGTDADRLATDNVAMDGVSKGLIADYGRYRIKEGILQRRWYQEQSLKEKWQAVPLVSEREGIMEAAHVTGDTLV